MFRLNLFLSALILSATLFLSGCSPFVVCQIETIVLPDYTCRRVLRMEGFPSSRFPQQRLRLGDYFQFPPAELYDTYLVQQDKVFLAGGFDSFDRIPSDVVRVTIGTTLPAGNIQSFRVMDLVLFVLADFDETITDIVANIDDGDNAMQELIRLCIPEIMSVLNARYGARFDLTRLESWLLNDLPVKLSRIYRGAWAIHGAKRSGVTSPGGPYEYYMFLKAEAKREGLELAEIDAPDLQQENIRRAREYLVRLADRLCVPRQPNAAGAGQEVFAKIAVDDLASSIQKAITARHGSINAFMAKIAALVPRAFGAYLSGAMIPFYMLPEVSYQYRLRIPGQILQSNGVRDMNGDLLWKFGDRDLAFTGQSMWARSIFVREPATHVLGLRGFPASLGDVDRLFGLCLTPAGTPREALLEAMRQAVSVRSTTPIEALANNAASSDAAAARETLELFSQHRKSHTPASRATVTEPADAVPADTLQQEREHPLAPIQPLPQK